MRAILFAFALLWTGAAPARDAVKFPSKPIRLIVPFTTGSASDVVARLLGEKLRAAWDQPIVIDNRPGAGGTIGIAQTAKAEPDGYTLVVVSSGHAVNHVLYKDLPYDTLKDLAGVAPLAQLPSVLVVSPALGVRSVKELVAAAKAKRGEFNYATGGVGSGSHLNAVKFNTAAGIDAVHIPLKGTPPILSETMSGRVQFSWVPSLSGLGPVKEGKLLALAVSTPKRVAALPDVPTIAEAGYPGGELVFWLGLLAPAKTPRQIVDKINAEVNRALHSADMKDRLASLGAEPMSMKPEQFDAFIRREYETLGKVMRDAGVKPE